MHSLENIVLVQEARPQTPDMISLTYKVQIGKYTEKIDLCLPEAAGGCDKHRKGVLLGVMNTFWD